MRTLGSRFLIQAAVLARNGNILRLRGNATEAVKLKLEVVDGLRRRIAARELENAIRVEHAQILEAEGVAWRHGRTC